MRKITMLLLIFLSIQSIQAQQIEAFDGATTNWQDYWCSGDGYVNVSYDSTLDGREGSAALRCEWKLDIVEWGGGCSFAYKVDAGKNIDMFYADTLSIWYYIEEPSTFEYKDSIAFSIILLDNPDQADYDANGTVEKWGFDAYGVYNNTVGWHTINIPLVESDDRTTGVMMQGDAVNGEFDFDKIKGYYIEWGNWGRYFEDTDGTIADSGVIYFDNMALGSAFAPTAIDEESENVTLEKYSLSQNYPNPFNPSTTISYSLIEAVNVKIDVYNVLGESISTLVNERKNAGVYSVNFNASNLNSGIYFYKISANNFEQVKKMMFIK